MTIEYSSQQNTDKGESLPCTVISSLLLLRRLPTKVRTKAEESSCSKRECGYYFDFPVLEFGAQLTGALKVTGTCHGRTYLIKATILDESCPPAQPRRMIVINTLLTVR